MQAQWFLHNLKLLNRAYPNSTIKYSSDFRQVLLNPFGLPPFYNKRQTALLLTTPGIYGVLNNPNEFRFYVDRSIRLRNGSFPHHIIVEDHSEFSRKGWIWVCLYFHSFNPVIADPRRGSLLIHLYQTLTEFLSSQEVVSRW